MQESDEHVVSAIVWNAACRVVFVGVVLRQSVMPLNWSVLGVNLRDTDLELSPSRLAQVNAGNPDVRARFAAILSNNMAVRYRTGNAQYFGDLGVASRDLLLHDVIHLKRSIYSLMQDV